MSLLQHYPIESAGGIDRLIQTGYDLARRREDEVKALNSNNAASLGARWRATMWKGFTERLTSPDQSSAESEDQQSEDDHPLDKGDDTDTPKSALSSGFTSRLATSVWRGITNQTSMEPPPSPITPRSPSLSPLPSPSPLGNNNEIGSPQGSQLPPGTSGIWGYAEKLKDSDTAATLAKVGSNWRAKALMGTWSVRGSPNSPPDTLPEQGRRSASRSESVSESYGSRQAEERRGSLPAIDRSGVYSPPVRPAFFRPPRDSIIITEGFLTTSPASPEMSPQSDSGFIARTRNLQASLASLTKSAPLTRMPTRQSSKSGPRPLLLSPTSPITSGPSNRISRSAGGTPMPGNKRGSGQDEWRDFMVSKVHHLHQDSLSSTSSLTPSDAFTRSWKTSQSGWDSDPSRRVPLNRRSVSPMAPNSRVLSSSRPASGSSAGTSPDRGILSPVFQSNLHMLDSPPLASRSVPQTPITGSHPNSTVIINDAEPQRGSVVLGDPTISEPFPSPRKYTQKKTISYSADETSDSSSKSPRVRSKRHPPRPPNIRVRDRSRSRSVPEQNNASLGVDWPVQTQDQMVSTPKASTFNGQVSPSSPSPARRRKVSSDSERPRTFSDGHEGRVRKVSTGSRSRKVSTGTIREPSRKSRDSAAEEGDDEGYDDLLSAYESEEGPP